MTYQEFQRGLIALGYDLGRAGADGVPGRMSNAATIAFKRRHGLSATPAIGPKTLEAMRLDLAAKGGTRPIREAIASSPAGLEPVWLIEARRWLGVAEVVGPGSNRRLLDAIRGLGVRALGMDYRDDDTPWCGAIMGVWMGATLPAEPLPSVVVRASSWERFGVALREPAPGAVTTFTRAGGGHVGLYLGETATDLVILGGNQSNRVSIALFSKAKRPATAFRWPMTVPLPRGGRVITDARGVPASRSEA